MIFLRHDLEAQNFKQGVYDAVKRGHDFISSTLSGQTEFNGKGNKVFTSKVRLRLSDMAFSKPILYIGESNIACKISQAPSCFCLNLIDLSYDRQKLYNF